jgi:hypothetical protein
MAGLETYHATPPGMSMGDGTAFYDAASTSGIRDLIREVLTREAPISVELLARRVSGRWGLTRVTGRVQERVRGLLPAGVVVRRAGTREFAWRSDQAPDDYAGFRVPGPADRSPRQAEDLPPEEVANAAARVLELHVSLDIEDLARETARLFGITRLGSGVRSYMQAGVELLGRRRGFRLDGSRASLSR